MKKEIIYSNNLRKDSNLVRVPSNTNVIYLEGVLQKDVFEALKKNQIIKNGLMTKTVYLNKEYFIKANIEFLKPKLIRSINMKNSCTKFLDSIGSFKKLMKPLSEKTVEQALNHLKK